MSDTLWSRHLSDLLRELETENVALKARLDAAERERDKHKRERDEARKEANSRICASCYEHHPIESMCPPYEVRTTGIASYNAIVRNLMKERDAVTVERDALKAAMPKPTASDRECADKVSECFGANEHGEMTFDYDKAQAIIAARVAEAVRPWRECVGELLLLVGDSSGVYAHRNDGTEVKWVWGEIDAIAHARRLMEEADRGRL